MKAHLLYREHDFDFVTDAILPFNQAELTADLGLDTLFEAMSGGDKFLLDVARRVVLVGLTDADDISYRAQILADCLAAPSVIRQMYDLSVEALEHERKLFWGRSSRSPDLILHRSVELVQRFLQVLVQLRTLASGAANFRSPGMSRFCAMLVEELDDDYIGTVENELRTLRFRSGVFVSARLGRGNRGTDYVLRAPREDQRSWLGRLTGGGRARHYLVVSERDEAGAEALKELRNRGVNLAANALAQSTDHILDFFLMLRRELAFYVGCLNLHARLDGKGEPWCFPVPRTVGDVGFRCQGLYDVCLSLRLEGQVVGNDVDAGARSLVVITGANQGGKSTFLRSVGLAQLMMQAGMFVGAREYSADIRDQVLTHYKREEDKEMDSGKLDEELRRMDDIVDHLTPNSMLVFNEAFAATNEREGSEIARQILLALRESGVKSFFVTHLFELADGLRADLADAAYFLRAQREDGGRRTFRLVEGAPLPTSFGRDIYNRVFADGADEQPAISQAS